MWIRHIVSVMLRELRSYFASPIAYVAMTMFAVISGFFFSNMTVHYVKQATVADQQIERLGRSPMQLDVPTMILSEFFKNEAFILMLVVPLLTMGLVTDERRKGTLELLLTSPLRPIELTLGKFFGALALFGLMLLPTLPFYAFLAQGGAWEPGVVASGYLGLLLVAAASISLGLFISSLCENVLVSAFATYGVLMALNFIDTSASVARSIWVDFIQYLSFFHHHVEFSRGVIALGDIAYFGSFVVLGLFLAQRSIEAVRYRRG
jgi:ABC-2 type transport system permease protein